MPKKVTKKPAKKAASTKKPAKKTDKSATKKQAKKPATRKPRKKAAHILPAPRKDVVVAPVVDPSGVVFIAPVLSDVVNS